MSLVSQRRETVLEVGIGKIGSDLSLVISWQAMLVWVSASLVLMRSGAVTSVQGEFEES